MTAADKGTQTPLWHEDEGKGAGGPVECLGMTFESDEARRAYFLDKLREKLADPEFRKIEGFPIGEDEDILRLSDPPYYTACPNPFIEDFIRCYGRPYDPEHDDYHREPFAADVSEGKNDPVYLAHSYHTKVPPRAIRSYLEHYTEPGDVVLDAFAGSGMTGVAAEGSGRTVVLCDLAPSATFIAYHYNAMLPVRELGSALQELMQAVQGECGWMYETLHDGREGAVLNYSILSEVFFCPECSAEVTYWDTVSSERCPHCGALVRKGDLLRKIAPDGRTEIRPVRVNYSFAGARFERDAEEEDVQLFRRVEATPIPHWYPDDLFMHRSAPWGDYYRSGYHQGYQRVSHFYTRRSLYSLACMWAAIDRLGLPDYLRFVVTSLLAMRCSLRMPYRQGGRSAGAINNLHIPSLIQEYNPIGVLERKGAAFVQVAPTTRRRSRVCITTQSSANLRQLPANSVDYIFVDPPFGNNIIYSELNFLWEAWLRVFSDQHPEAIVSTYQRKGFDEYQSLMRGCFEAMYETLKPGRWMTLEFHNSRNAVWNAIQQALTAAGFVVADVRTLDKQQGSYKQVSTAGAVKRDLIISAYKPSDGLERRFALEAGTQEGGWSFVRAHLEQLPVFVLSDGRSEVIAERTDYLLFDRMVAFHVQRGVTVPFSAAEFYAGLKQLFVQRDGMYFLPAQVAEYDQKRAGVGGVTQLQLVITGEESAVNWLRLQLASHPQTFQDLHPQFMREIAGWDRHEKPLELSELLEQNFLCYDGVGPVPEQIHQYLSRNVDALRDLAAEHPAMIAAARDRWYVPDPNKASDLEKLRERTLLREFEEYRRSKERKLKVFRFEAVRAGFKRAWQERDYATIVELARKIPEEVLQEDPKLLMWLNQAETRLGEA